MRPNISVILTSRARLRLFKNSYNSIASQLTPSDELVVIEEAEERAGWIDFLKSQNIPWQFVNTNEPNYRGCSIAKNMALMLCNNPWIAINDPEVTHITPCITQASERLISNDKQFIVAGTLYSEKDNQTGFETANKMENSQAPFFALTTKDNLTKVGGWDERFKFWGNDDNDLMHRLGMSGVSHVVCNDMVVFHQWHQRPPEAAHGDYNHELLYEENKQMIANQNKKWGSLRGFYMNHLTP